jgi:hypothetical protein
VSVVVHKPVEIDCEEVWRHISDYLDKEGDPELRFNLEAHFKDCAHCSAILDGTRNVLQLVGDGRIFELPTKTSKRLYAKLDEHLGRNNP